MELAMRTTAEQDTWLAYTHVPLRSISFQPFDDDCAEEDFKSKCITQNLVTETTMLAASTHTLEVTPPPTLSLLPIGPSCWQVVTCRPRHTTLSSPATAIPSDGADGEADMTFCSRGCRRRIICLYQRRRSM